MNLLLVNPVHPSTPHVSAVRAWRFACSLADMGHRVVLLTAAGMDMPAVAPATLVGHDWRRPAVIAPAALTMARAPAGRNRMLQRLRTGVALLRRGGYQSAWIDAALHSGQRLAAEFRPDAIWATFGKMEAVFVARRLSRDLGVPWILDLKDNWELFVPKLLRRIMAWRVRGWQALSANSEQTAELAARWHGAPARVIYSGIEEAFMGVGETRGEPLSVRHHLHLNLIGSLYDTRLASELLSAIDEWFRTLAVHDRERLGLRYMGADGALFTRLAEEAGTEIPWRAVGYLPVAEMAGACRGALLNMYIANDVGFHHKLLELLACGRPVLAYPRETGEARALNKRVHGAMIEPGNEAGIMQALNVALAHAIAPQHTQYDPALFQDYSWPSQARRLERMLADAAAAG